MMINMGTVHSFCAEGFIVLLANGMFTFANCFRKLQVYIFHLVLSCHSCFGIEVSPFQ